MSRAQKLVNWALAILARRLPPEGLNDQKVLAELRALFKDAEDHGVGTASDMVKQTKSTLASHLAGELRDHEAMAKILGILDRPKASPRAK